MAAVMELGGALVMGMKDPKSSALVDLRRSLPLDVKPLRRGALSLTAASSSATSFSSSIGSDCFNLTALPASSTTSFSSSIGQDCFDLGAQTICLSNVDRRSTMDQSEAVTLETLDKWLRDSISEIVRNIRKAPLLVHMFSDREGVDVNVESEAASPDIWSRITRRWNQEKRMPDGVVLVEELCRDGEERQTWGLLVQGRGAAYPASYILNTCRVRSTAGFCTHFCLVRAECYGESAQMQFLRAWSR